MKSLAIQKNCTEDVTLISNHFLDYHMPKANGEFVKIYLYLLRKLNDRSCNLTLSAIADTFDCTENDVERALRYWDKMRVICLAFDEEHAITGLTLLPLSKPTAENPPLPTAPTTLKTPEGTGPATAEGSRTLTADRVRELKQNDEVMQLLFIAEQYLGRTLSPSDVSRILFFYAELHLSPDLIEYLIEYCVSKGSRSVRYMEKVALAWAENGITTVAMAKQESHAFNKQYFTVLKAFGISGRNPVESEIQAVDHWMKELGFTTDIIIEACVRTVNQTGKPSFPYADGILKAWHSQGVRSFEDIGRLDTHHREGRRPVSQKTPKSSNKFNNFHQRDYDFSDLEKQLLKS